MPKLKDLSLTVSIVCYDSTDQDLKSTLESLLTSLAQLPAAGYQTTCQICFVDNSVDHKLQLDLFKPFNGLLDSVNAELRILKGHGNVGYGKGHNLIIQPSTDIYHLILNPDVELDRNCLSEGITFLEHNHDVAIVSPYAVTADGHKQHLCKRYPSVSTFVIRGFFPAWIKKYFRKTLSHHEMHDLPEDLPSHAIPLVSGCFMLCRTEKLQLVKGFDENYFMYFEDFDLSLRVGKIGKLAYLPAMKITHHGGHSAGKGLRHILLFTKSAIRFFNTYGWRLIQ
ncbi:MAG: glycosyltransferase [Gammaproteobacteria bacterium]|nr:glycosyltransferase [Gammaproteobacteria bacterium]